MWDVINRVDEYLEVWTPTHGIEYLPNPYRRRATVDFDFQYLRHRSQDTFSCRLSAMFSEASVPVEIAPPDHCPRGP